MIFWPFKRYYFNLAQLEFNIAIYNLAIHEKTPTTTRNFIF